MEYLNLSQWRTKKVTSNSQLCLWSDLSLPSSSLLLIPNWSSYSSVEPSCKPTQVCFLILYVHSILKSMFLFGCSFNSFTNRLCIRCVEFWGPYEYFSLLLLFITYLFLSAEGNLITGFHCSMNSISAKPIEALHSFSQLSFRCCHPLQQLTQDQDLIFSSQIQVWARDSRW